MFHFVVQKEEHGQWYDTHPKSLRVPQPLAGWALLLTASDQEWKKQNILQQANDLWVMHSSLAHGYYAVLEPILSL